MSRIGVVSALPLEARCLRGRRRFSCGPLGAPPAAAMLGVAGPGPARAQRLAEQLVEQGATGLVSWGLAGGLDPRIAPGTLIVADRVVIATGGEHPTDPVWRQRILSALPLQVLAVEAPLLASDAVASTAQDKAVLLGHYAAAAVDMESGGIARVASHFRLPFLVLRVVVDPAGMTLPPALAKAVDGRGALRLAYLANALARQPRMLRSLLALAWNARIATSTLRRIAPVITGDSALHSSAPRGRLSALP